MKKLISKSKNKINRLNGFEGVTAAIAVAVTLFVFVALSFIVIKGFPYLTESLYSKEVQFAVGMSIKTSLISTAICIVLGIPTAYALTRPGFKARGLCGIIIELPLSIPNIMLGLSLLLMFSSAPGKFLSSHGFRVIFNVNGIILAHILVNLPFVIRMVRTAFLELDPHMELIAGTLGASKTKTFFLIMMPMVKNAVIGAGILALSRALGEFGATLMVAGATRMKTETIPVSIYLNMATGDTEQAMSCAMLLLIISGLAMIIANRFTGRVGEEKKRKRGTAGNGVDVA